MEIRRSARNDAYPRGDANEASHSVAMPVPTYWPRRSSATDSEPKN